MDRFFIPPEWFEGDSVIFQNGPSYQLIHVLRKKPQDRVIALDNTGWEYEIEMERFTGDSVKGRILNKSRPDTEPVINLTLYQALLKADNFELVLQKGVELGAIDFRPFISERCVVRRPDENKIDRWQKIVREAAEQCGRTRLPAVHPVVIFREACDQSAGNPAIIFWEEEENTRLSSVLKEPFFRESDSISIFIGPEGGFPSSEVEYARSRGIEPVSLGRRVLRAETAAIAAMSAVLYEKGELG
jgi:16S rRNA (uracil1498-N3)-methyltransferase